MDSKSTNGSIVLYIVYCICDGIGQPEPLSNSSSSTVPPKNSQYIQNDFARFAEIRRQRVSFAFSTVGQGLIYTRHVNTPTEFDNTLSVGF